jgi:hypothetical protein
VHPLCRLADRPRHAMPSAGIHSIWAAVLNDSLHASRSSHLCSSAAANSRRCSSARQIRPLPVATLIPGSSEQSLTPAFGYVDGFGKSPYRAVCEPLPVSVLIVLCCQPPPDFDNKNRSGYLVSLALAEPAHAKSRCSSPNMRRLRNGRETWWSCLPAKKLCRGRYSPRRRKSTARKVNSEAQSTLAH